MNLELSQPIKFGEKTLKEITLREPTIGECMSALSFATNDDHYGFVMSLVASVTVLQFQFIEEMTSTDLNKASEFLQTFPIMPSLDFTKTKVQTPFLVPVSPPIEDKNRTLDVLEINDPKAKMVREANALLKGDINLEKIQARNFKLVQLITGADSKMLARVPVSVFRKAEDAALSFL